MPAIPAIIMAVGAVGAAAYSSHAANVAAKKANANANAMSQADASQQVGGSEANQTEYARLGRAALISTSPSGVQGLDPTGRRRLLGND